MGRGRPHIKYSDLHRDDCADLVLGCCVVGFAELHDVNTLQANTSLSARCLCQGLRYLSLPSFEKILLGSTLYMEWVRCLWSSSIHNTFHCTSCSHLVKNCHQPVSRCRTVSIFLAAPTTWSVKVAMMYAVPSGLGQAAAWDLIQMRILLQLLYGSLWRFHYRSAQPKQDMEDGTT